MTDLHKFQDDAYEDELLRADVKCSLLLFYFKEFCLEENNEAGIKAKLEQGSTVACYTCYYYRTWNPTECMECSKYSKWSNRPI